MCAASRAVHYLEAHKNGALLYDGALLYGVAPAQLPGAHSMLPLAYIFACATG